MQELGGGIEQAVWGQHGGHQPQAFEPDAHTHRPVEDVLADLDAAATRLAGVLDRVDAADWQRADADGNAAALLAGEAAHEGAHHLRLAEQVLEEVRGR